MDTVIQPRRLESTYNEHNCMFCIKPVGPTFISFIDAECKFGYFNCGLCTLATEQAMDLWHDIINFIPPQRLVMVRIENNCMFCQYPTGPSYGRFVDDEAKYGYIHCDKCMSSVNRTMELWDTYFAYGRVKYLQGQDIKVKRSSGAVDSGWKIDSPFIGYAPCGSEIIHCFNKEENLVRWCKVDDIMELNPLEKPVFESNKPVYDDGRLSPISE